MEIKAVLFDIDNTLYDTKTLAVNARRNAVKAMIEAGLKADVDEAVKKLKKIVKEYGPNFDHHYDKLIESYRMQPNPRIVAAGIVAYHATKIAYLVPYPQTIPTLLKLKERNTKIGVVTDGLPVKQWEKIIRLGLQHFFDAVVISEELKTRKPDEKLFTHALEKLDAKPAETLMVGDRVDKDIQGAKKAGITTVQILHPEIEKKRPQNELQYPDYVLGDLSELLEIL